MGDEILARVQARCAHEWGYTAGVGKQCIKCALLWETWAEERIHALETLLHDETEAESEAAAHDAPQTQTQSQSQSQTQHIKLIWNLLPPQTVQTCRHCDGTGIEPFGDCAAVCILCRVAYDTEDVFALAEQHPDTVLPCGHALSQIRLFYECQRCHGSGHQMS